MKNFFGQHYKKYIYLPLALVVLSLVLVFIFPKIPLGSDFKGGLLFTIESSQPISPQVSAELEKELAGFSKTVSVSNPSEKSLEIEMDLNQKFEDVNKLNIQMLSANGELMGAEVNATYYSGIESATEDAKKNAARVDELKKEVNSLASQVFAGLGKRVPSSKDVHDLALQAKVAFDDEKQSFKEQIVAIVGKKVKIESVSMKEVGALLSQQFFSKIINIFIFSFLAASVLVLILFRSFVPAFAVVFGAFADITITMGAMTVFGIPLTLASFAGLLMLIGFSLDTDVLLTIRVLKRREGDPKERAFGAMKTGVLMSVCAIVAFGVLFIAASFLQINVYLEIASVVMIGSVADLIATWMFNAPMVLNFVEKKEKDKVSI